MSDVLPTLEDAPSVATVQNIMRDLKHDYPNWTHPPTHDTVAWKNLIWEWRCNLQGFPVDMLVACYAYHKAHKRTAPSACCFWVALDELREGKSSESVAAKAMTQMRSQFPQMFRGK